MDLVVVTYHCLITAGRDHQNPNFRKEPSIPHRWMKTSNAVTGGQFLTWPPCPGLKMSLN